MLSNALLTGLEDWGCLATVSGLHACASSAHHSVLKNLPAAEASKLAMELVAELMASDLEAHLLPKLGIVRIAELANLLKGCRLLIHCGTD